MPSVHRLLASINNVARTASVTASSVQPAVNQVYRQPTARAGNGLVRLAGGYTGAQDATIDVEIRPPVSGAERLSTPVFAGAGNGPISDLTVAPGALAQSVAATLVDAGTPTTSATLALYGALTLRAKTAGVAGNAIRLTVTPALTLSAALGATAAPLSRNTQETDDPRLDFGALALNADGSVPATAPRLVFNGDLSRVYRHYKRWQDGRWQYGFSPALAADIPINSPVQPVSGTYSVAVSDGVTTETYPALATLYDLLRALAGSALVAVDGVVANDPMVNGQAAIDLPLRTSAWIAGVTPDKGLPALAATVAASAVTDRVTVACTASRLNADLWSVTSAASGSLGTATTHVPFNSTVAFTIPLQPASAASAASAPVLLRQTQFVGRPDPDDPLPVLVVKKGTLGAKAAAKSFTLKYTARPDIACDSAGYQPAGVLSPTLLGLPNEAFTNLDANFQSRLQLLYDYRKQFVARNSRIRPVPATVKPVFTATATKAGNPTRTTTFATAADLDAWRDYHIGDGWAVTAVPLIERSFSAGLLTRANSTAYGAGQRIAVTLPDQSSVLYLDAQVGGTSGIAAPIWSDNGEQRTDAVTDGTVVWARGTAGLGVFSQWQPGQSRSIGTNARIGGLDWYVATAGTTGQTTQVFYQQTPRPGPFVDGSVIWGVVSPATAGSTWAASTSIAVNTLFVAGAGLGYYVCTTAGTTGSAAPIWGTADVLTDGTVTWTRAVTYEAISARLSTQDLAFVDGVLSILGQCLSDIYSSAPARALWDATWTAAQTDLQTLYDIGGSVEQVLYDPGFMERYRSQCDSILVSIGISPGKFEAGSQGSAVWPDTGDAFWWAFTDADYLPLFTNQIYHSCRRNADGEPASTQEFAFALVCACPERLMAGDTVQIEIQSGAAGGGGYPVGATYTIDIIGAAPLALAGGAAGTDTLTWQVVSSVQGALADYALTAAEPAYSAGGLGFRLRRGELPFALGDRFDWSVETGGRYRWRKDSGAWSADTALPAAPVALTDGLTAAFEPGPAPGFVAGDVHAFVVRQPASPHHILTGDGREWQWVGASATLTLDFGADQSISAVGLLRHALDAPATVSIALQNAAGTTLQTVPLTVAPGPLMAFLATPLTVRKIVITLGAATGMRLGWVYAGTPLVPSHNASNCTVRRVYAVERGGGINPRGAYLGAGRAGEISWTDWLSQADLTALLALIDDCKRAGDEPLVLVPSAAHPAEAALCRISGDEVEIADLFQFQPSDANRRRLSVKIPLTAVVA